jgi:hypothetical protein
MTTEAHTRGGREAMGLGERGFSVPEKATPSSLLGQRFAAELVVLDGDDDLVELVEVPARPRVRGDCAAGERPCPWVACRHHLAIDVDVDTGSLKINDTLDLTALRATCALDVADAGQRTLEEVGQHLNLTRERVRQLEARGLEKLRAGLARRWIRKDDLPFITDRSIPEPR